MSGDSAAVGEAYSYQRRKTMSDENQSNSRLSRIETLWSVVRRAHDAQDSIALSAQQQLLDIYGGAIQRYLLASLKDSSAADDLFQEFALKFVKGDLRGVDPERGRFRYYVKKVVSNLMNQHRRKQASRKEQLLLEEDQQGDSACAELTSDEDRLFLASWRDDLLEQTWDAMAEHESKTGTPYNSVLRLRVGDPALSSEEFAEKLSALIGKPMTSGTARVTLHRARDKFANLLISVISDSLESPDKDAIESEMIDLGLIDYCREALASFEAG